ncbi:hypothetical protein [Actinomyces radicidentis]|uniref:hypothetical protein n=1 Tax=Actinomyces radicidentis TaxID=111015 RepID=UPI0026DF2CA2|nr:hypothetical protein [Actinomyces radicidentis]
MSPLPALALAAYLIAIILILAVGARRTRRRHAEELAELPGPVGDELRAVDAHERRTRSLAIAVGLVLALVLAGVQLAVALGACGLISLAILVFGEWRSPAITTRTRSAALAPRRTRDYLRPAALAMLTLVLAAIVADCVVGFPVAATAPYSADLGDTTQTLAAGTYLLDTSRMPSGGTLTQAYGPWPGPGTMVPVLVGLAVQVAVAAWALHWVAARAQVSTVQLGNVDDVLRHRSADAVLGILLLGSSLILPVVAVPMIDAATWEAAQWDYARGTVGGVGLLVGLGAMALGTHLLLRRDRLEVATPEAPVVTNRTVQAVTS